MPETQSTRRVRWLLRILLLWVLAIFARLAWLQVLHHDDLLKAAQQQQQKMVEIQAVRGSILDRGGQPLAKSLPAESICVNPLKIPDRGMAADLLSQALGMDRARLLERLSAAAARSSGFLWIKRKVSAKEAARVRSFKMEWVEFRPDMRRFYPHAQLAAHVVGSTGSREDGAEGGNAGIELAFEDELAGRPGLQRIYTDVLQKPYDSVLARMPEPGATLTLTIDRSLQYELERELEKAVKQGSARSGSGVILNPYTGDILAMANYPAFDPNSPPVAGDDPIARTNLAVTSPYEPGSVMKVFTVAAALETTQIRPDTVMNCGNGTINLFGRVIHDHHSYAALSVADVLAKSSNIGAIQVGLKVGEQRLYNYEQRFGFGRRTGIDLPGESPGQLRRLERWTPSSIGSVAIGHEIGVTTLQLALGGAAIANGGLLVKPRLVAARQRPGAELERFAPEKAEQILRPETTIQLRQMMEGVVLRGTGKNAALKGYRAGGKTGSAQIYDPETKAYSHRYNASFLGFAPVANPQIVVAITIHHTTTGEAGFGAAVAAPVFREVATTALRMLDVAKDLPEKDVPESLLRASRDQATDENDLAIAGLGGAPYDEESESPAKPARNAAASASVTSKTSATGADQPAHISISARNAAPPARTSSSARDAAPAARDRSVSSVTPPPVPQDAPSQAGASGVDRRPFFASALTGPKAPDFRGMTLRGVLEAAAARGLEVEVQGSGLARTQEPPAGTVLPPGVRVRVQFAR